MDILIKIIIKILIKIIKIKVIIIDNKAYKKNNHYHQINK